MLTSTNTAIDCENCGHDTIPCAVSDWQHWGQQKFWVENLELDVCPNCGARYYSPAALDILRALAEQYAHAA
jgi:YgiT-type zinc finger domain-containing protein